MHLQEMVFPQKSWITGAGHAAQTASLGPVTGTIVRADVIISSVTADPDVSTTVTDENSVTLLSTGALDDGTTHCLLARSFKGTPDADFNPTPVVDEILTVSIDPSADAGGEAQTLTVDVILTLEVE